MHKGIFKIAVFLMGLVVFGEANASAQQIQSRSPRTGSGAEGTLAVTATVVSSTGVVIGPDGKQRVIVANAEDPGGSAPYWPAVKAEPHAPASDQKPDAKPPQEKQKQP